MEKAGQVLLSIAAAVCILVLISNLSQQPSLFALSTSDKEYSTNKTCTHNGSKHSIGFSGPVPWRDIHIATLEKSQAGSWIGNTWFPPSHWRLYNAAELQSIFSDISIALVGDSTIRRVSVTLLAAISTEFTKNQLSVSDDLTYKYPIKSYTNQVPLSAVDDAEAMRRYKTESDCNEHVVPANLRSSLLMSLCTDLLESYDSYNATNKRFIIGWAPCMTELENFLREEVATPRLTTIIDVLVIGIGIWEFNFESYKACHAMDKKNRSIEQRMIDIFDAIQQLLQSSSNLTIIWRTNGFSGEPNEINDKIVPINNQARKLVSQIARDNKSSNLLILLDWAAAMEPRSFGKYRIEGDGWNHWGVEARLVMIQMLANIVASYKTQ